ncbi:ABC transporter ATP-binding protein [Roseibium sp. M-1]
MPVVKDVSMTVPTGEITVLLGANGAGRTTLLEGISGELDIQSGEISLGSLTMTKASRSSRSRSGLGHVEQGRTIFTELSVEENFLVSCEKSKVGPAFEWFPELVKRRNTKAGMLSGGEQQMLVIARALLRHPKVLMIDEMSLGLAPVIVRRLLDIIKELVEDGLGVLLVEQFAHLALQYGNCAYVMSGGRIVLSDDCAALVNATDRLHDAYLS